MDDVLQWYGRRQAIVEGVLIDVTDQAREMGCPIPVALTANLWAKWRGAANEPENDAGNVIDVLQVLRCAMRCCGDEPEMKVAVIIHRDTRPPMRFRLKAVYGTDDDGDPVVTVMLPHEDYP